MSVGGRVAVKGTRSEALRSELDVAFGCIIVAVPSPRNSRLAISGPAGQRPARRISSITWAGAARSQMPLAIAAQIVRAMQLANATVTTFMGLRASIRSSQSKTRLARAFLFHRQNGAGCQTKLCRIIACGAEGSHFRRRGSKRAE